MVAQTLTGLDLSGRDIREVSRERDGRGWINRLVARVPRELLQSPILTPLHRGYQLLPLSPAQEGATEVVAAAVAAPLVGQRPCLLCGAARPWACVWCLGEEADPLLEGEEDPGLQEVLPERVVQVAGAVGGELSVAGGALDLSCSDEEDSLGVLGSHQRRRDVAQDLHVEPCACAQVTS